MARREVRWIAARSLRPDRMRRAFHPRMPRVRDWTVSTDVPQGSNALWQLRLDQTARFPHCYEFYTLLAESELHDDVTDLVVRPIWQLRSGQHPDQMTRRAIAPN